MNKKAIEDIYPLSPTQHGLLFHTLYAPTSGVYVEQLACTLRGELDVAAFERAWTQVVERHAVLRSAFVWEGRERPLQVVRRQVAIPWERHDWRTLPPQEQQALDTGLEKTKDSFFSKITKVVAGKSTVDDDVLDDLEEVLVTSDVGVSTTLKIIKRIQDRVARDKYVSTSELNNLLRDEIQKLLAENNSNDFTNCE